MRRLPFLPLILAAALAATPLHAAGAALAGAAMQTTAADSLYQEARKALNRNDHRAASTMFRTIAERYPDTPFASDALYWLAFSLYRLGGDANLRQAAAVLEEQMANHPRAATDGDARALAVRINGELARLGDPEAAVRIAEEATAAERAVEARAERDAERQAEQVEREAERIERDTERVERDAERLAEIAERRAEIDAERAEIERVRRDDCPNEEDDVRIAALSALQQMDPLRALPLLQRVLAMRDPCSVELRRLALFVVTQVETPAAIDILMDAARNDPDPEVRAEAVHWLGEVDDERAVDMLVDILRSSSDAEVRENAIFALSEHESPRAREILRDIATRRDAPTEERAQAIYWLSQADEGGDTFGFLTDLFRANEDPEIREAILYAVSRIEHPDNGRWLLEVALDPRQPSDLREQALHWAGDTESAPVSEMVDLYDRAGDRELKEQLLYVYSQREEPEAIDKLIEVARHEPDGELRKQAIYWLSQTDDPRVADILQEIIAP